MSAFTEREVEYMREQRLERLATVDVEGRPHVVPEGFRYGPELDTVDIGGYNIAASKKFRDVQRTGRAAFVVVDVTPTWRARGVEVRGRAEVLSEGGREVMEDFSEELIRVYPERIVGWGLDSAAFSANSRSVG